MTSYFWTTLDKKTSVSHAKLKKRTNRKKDSCLGSFKIFRVGCQMGVASIFILTFFVMSNCGQYVRRERVFFL